MRTATRTAGRPIWLVLACFIALGPFALADGPPSGYAGSDACAMCHDVVAANLAMTTHGKTARSTPDGASGCEACHGPGAAHVDAGGDPELMRNLAEIPADEAADVCLACHESGNRNHWKGSAHDGRGVSCVDCHTAHFDGKPPKALLARGTEADSCATCHMQMKAAMLRSAHMPVREGAMACSSCH